MHAARNDLAALAFLLRSEVPLTARAAAQVSLLDYDRRSPIHRATDTTAIPLDVARIYATVWPTSIGAAST